MSVVSRVSEHITRTVLAPPSATITRFPRVASTPFKAADTGGARLDLDHMVGQSRVFELALEDSLTTPLSFGGPAPIAYREEFPIRVRYESHGPARRSETLKEIKEDQLAICDALQRSSWSTVQGLASLSASPANVISFVIQDENSREYSGFISEIAVSISFDI
tara:strand:- start:2455 stop:2946 length:492 start_codon:yes stop_codon:yes gene_type:complete